jgi:molecular chaperone DnaK
VNENRAKLSAAEIGPVEAATSSLRQATQADDLAAIRAGIDELQKASHKMAEALYQQSGAQPDAGGPAGSGPEAGAQAGGKAPEGGGQGDVIDAEVVDEGKK